MCAQYLLTLQKFAKLNPLNQ
jgi:hypothetical protein